MEFLTSHTTPVGGGTVARITRIPVTKRAEAAVIAMDGKRLKN